MNPGGIVLMIAGSWVLLQVLGGKALQRLGWVPDTGSGGALPGTPGSNGDSGLGDGGQSGGGAGGGGGSSW
jgi:hypothetical protein